MASVMVIVQGDLREDARIDGRGLIAAPYSVARSSTPHLDYDARMLQPRALLPLLSVLLFATASCGKEAGRIRLANEGAGEVTVDLKAAAVSFWTDIDIEYEGDAALAYTLTLGQNGAPVAVATCNPLGRLPMKTGWVETNIGNSHSRRGSGKMTCEAMLAHAGPTSVRAALSFSQRPAKLQLKKADLVVKQ